MGEVLSGHPRDQPKTFKILKHLIFGILMKELSNFWLSKISKTYAFQIYHFQNLKLSENLDIFRGEGEVAGVEKAEQE